MCMHICVLMFAKLYFYLHLCLVIILACVLVCTLFVTTAFQSDELQTCAVLHQSFDSVYKRPQVHQSNAMCLQLCIHFNVYDCTSSKCWNA